MIKDINHKLVILCKQNNSKAQRKVFELYADAMLNVAIRITNDYELAQDIIQESFIKVFTRISSFDEKSTLGAWIKRIVINQALNEVKKKKEESLDENFDQIEENSESEVDWSIEGIKTNMALLPEKARTVFSLYAFEGYDHAEIGEIMNISVEGSKSQYSRAKKKLRELITLESCKKI